MNNKVRIKIENDIERIKHEIIVSRENYDIWWIYKHERPKYVNLMNKYIGFFSVSIHAHFTAMLLSISKILDPKPQKNFSLFSLIKYAEAQQAINKELLLKSNKELQDILELISKIQILRNNHFAHLSKHLDYDNMLNKAEIRYADFDHLINISGNILNKISYNFNKSRLSSFRINAANDTHLLLDALMK